MSILDLNGSGVLNIRGVFEKSTWPAIVLTHYDDDKVTPLDLSGDYKMVLSKRKDFYAITAEIDGDTNDNVLTISKPDSISVLAGRYHYQILNRIGEETYVRYTGTITVNEGTSWPG